MAWRIIIKNSTKLINKTRTGQRISNSKVAKNYKIIQQKLPSNKIKQFQGDLRNKLPSTKLQNQINSLKRKFQLPGISSIGDLFDYTDSATAGKKINSSYVAFVAFVPYVNGKYDQVDGIIYLEYHTRTPVLFRNVNIDAYELVRKEGGRGARLIEEKFRPYRNRTSANAEYNRRIREYEDFKKEKSN